MVGRQGVGPTPEPAPELEWKSFASWLLTRRLLVVPFPLALEHTLQWATHDPWFARQRRLSALGVGLGRLALELERDERFIARYPRVMPWLKPVRVTGTKIKLAPGC